MCSMFYFLQDRLVVDGDQVAELYNLFRLFSFYQGYTVGSCIVYTKLHAHISK